MKPLPPSLALPPIPRWSLRVLVLVHVLAGAAMGLSVDEAHYLLYALRPALSYFDHPPLVGWIQWPLVAAQVPEAALRVLPALVWWGTLAGVYRLTRHVLSAQPATEALAESAATWALAALALAPLLHVLGLGLLPDTLLMAWTVAVMACTWSLMHRPPETGTASWLLLGALLGLAGLSKYTAIFAALAVLLCLLQAHGWALLRHRGPWLALVLALALVSPVLVWNLQNQWVSFAYQAQHGAGGGWKGVEFVRFVVVQLLAYGPLLLAAVAGWRAAPSAVRALAWFAAIPLGVLGYLSGGGTGLPHWTAPAWVAAAPLAGLGLARWAQQGWRGWLRVLGGLQALACTALVALMLTAGWPFAQGSDDTVAPAPNPFADLYGWQQAGALARGLAQREGLAALAVQNWTLASRLGWYARPLPVQVLEDRFTQFSLWHAPMQPGGDALLVDWSHMAYDVPMAPHGFTRCRLLDTLPVQHQGRPLASFRFYACYGWEGSPAPQLTRRGTP
ncbi:glycosyltransferase family 39 protein [Curvibacter sp. APW13]|uniref:glycosyltransferase family 39 protein n=1 Tax=Curvibacter sp. APW13 TaxID=3077236 RepID=UPI0028DE9C83|nr:glycosyltransferase family 39 protein [Curvibacter sp. APW13]MDT8990009.1 glycosyltransferase family 39 protein [Curvibacter sp. APW13]